MSLLFPALPGGGRPSQAAATGAVTGTAEPRAALTASLRAAGTGTDWKSTPNPSSLLPLFKEPHVSPECRLPGKAHQNDGVFPFLHHSVTFQHFNAT